MTRAGRGERRAGVPLGVGSLYHQLIMSARIPEPDKTELAQNRTELAEDRTILAHERSFAGWVRTGMAAVGIGLGFNALFVELRPVWAPKAIASLFLLIAIFIFVSAERRAHQVTTRLQSHAIQELKPVRIRILTAALVFASSALIIAIWTLA